MSDNRIKELSANEEFVKDLFESKSYEEAQNKFANKGVVVSVDDIKKAYELILKKQNGELSDEELEEISGGLLVTEGLLLGAFVFTCFVAPVGTQHLFKHC